MDTLFTKIIEFLSRTVGGKLLLILVAVVILAYFAFLGLPDRYKDKLINYFSVEQNVEELPDFDAESSNYFWNKLNNEWQELIENTADIVVVDKLTDNQMNKLKFVTIIDLENSDVLYIPNLDKNLFPNVVTFIGNSKLKSIENICSFTKLIHIDLGSSNINDFSSMKCLSKLKRLQINKINSNHISSIKQLFPNLIIQVQ